MVQVNDFLRNYRLTPHPATGLPPSELLFGRLPSSRLPHLQQHDGDYKRRIQEAADKRRRVQEHYLQVGDKVFRRKEAKLLNKTPPFYEEEAYVVTNVNGSAITARNSRHTVTCNSSFFRKVPVVCKPALDCFDIAPEEEDVPVPPCPYEAPPPQQRKDRCCPTQQCPTSEKRSSPSTQRLRLEFLISISLIKHFFFNFFILSFFSFFLKLKVILLLSLTNFLCINQIYISH